MKLIRICLALFSVIGMTLVLSGCTTRKLITHTYGKTAEDVSSVQIAKDNSTIGILGDGQYYLIEAPNGLVEILSSPLHKSMKADFQNFRVDVDKNVTGRCVLTLNPLTTSQDIEEAQNLGFNKNKAGNFERQFSLKGTQHNGDYYYLPGSRKELNQKYKVEMSNEMRKGEKTFNTIAVPFFIVADAELVLFKAANMGLKVYTYPVRKLFGDSF